jgi:xylulokinase
LTGFTAPKVLWVRNHEPKTWEKVRQVLLPKDYIRYRLSGTYATEVSDASGTLFLDVANRAWSRELLERLELDPAILPPCSESPEVSATVSEIGSAATGLLRGTPIVGGGGDQPAGAVGNGIVRAGVVSATMGTSGVVFAHIGELGYDPLGRLQRFCHSVPGEYCAFGCVLSAGGSFKWVRDELGDIEVAAEPARHKSAYELLSDEAALAKAGCEGLFFLPYLTGERTPHFDPDARGGWIGLTVRHTRSDLIRSVLEGVTFAMRDSLELIKETGVKIQEIRLSGGGAKGQLWRQIQADVYGQEVCTINASEGPAFGAALLALVGIGAYQTVPEACDRSIQVISRTAVQAKAAQTYERGYAVYRKLYSDLKGTFKQMASLSEG